MFEKNRVVKNAAWIIAARLVQAVLNLLITMLTARFLGPANYGLLNYAMSVVAFVVPVMQLGLTGILVQELVANPDREGQTLGTAMYSSLASGVLSMIGVLAFVSVANHDSPETILVCGLYSLTLLAQAMETIQYWFQAHLLSRYSSLVSLGAYLVTAIYKAVLLFRGKSIYWFALANTLDFTIIAVVLLVMYHKKGGQPLKFSYSRGCAMLAKSKYFILSGLMVTVFAQTDRIMLNLMIGEEATGFYSAAVTCAGMTNFVFIAILDSVRPVAFADRKEGKEKFENTLKLLYALIIWLAMIQSIGIALLAKPVVLILYGEAYTPTVSALRIIIWYCVFSYIGPVRNIWMLAENKQHLIWKIDVSGAIANVFFNCLLIPAWGINGAAAASLITQIFTNVFMSCLLKEMRPNYRLMVQALNPSILLEAGRKILPSKGHKDVQA